MEDIDFRIIIIDDNPSIHHDFIKILKASQKGALDDVTNKMFGAQLKGKDQLLPKFQIDTASQGEEGVSAVKAAKENGEPYSLAFVDIRMPPGLDGIETIKRLWEIDPDIQTVICTAYSDYSWEETVEQLGKTDNLLILKKPFDNVSVRQLACALTKKWKLLQETREFTNYLKDEVNKKTTSLQTSLSLVKATLESSEDGIVVISKEGKITGFNNKFLQMLNIDKNFIKSVAATDLIKYIADQTQEPEDFTRWFFALNREENIARLELIHLNNGKIFDCYAQPQKINKEMIGTVLNFRDITKRAKLEMQLQYQATHDSLTNLPNRIYVLDEIRAAIKTAIKTSTMMAVIYLDLDRFKLINDSISHAAGDLLLQEVADRLRHVIRTTDTASRIGGDEFIIVLPHIRTPDNVAKLCEKILDVLKEPVHLNERDIMISASLGISIYPTDGRTTEVLVRNADAAMYAAKESGGSKYQFYSQKMHQQSVEKLDKETQLHNALKNNEFVLYYQPQYDLASQKLIAAEALIRWQHPKEGLLLPNDFIPIAEETGLIIPIGEWVIKTACLQNKAWQDQGFPPMRIAVNITGLQLKQNNIVEKIKNILKETNLEPKFLELELTENTIISSEKILETIAELKKFGIVITIDDFGTGYSSLSYLKKLPLDRLKIDRSFIEHIKEANDDDVIIRSIISLAKNLNLEVLAEGVENETQINFLRKHECDEIQGFYFSKPVNSEEFFKIMSQSNDYPNELFKEKA